MILVGFGSAASLPFLSPFHALLGYALIWKATDSTKNIYPLWGLFFLVNLIQTSWLLYHPFLYIIAGWILISLLLSLPFALLSKLVYTQFSKIALAALFTLLFWSFSHLPCGWTFQSPALSLAWHLFPLQLASIIGELGLIFLVFLTNLFFFSEQFKNWAFLAVAPYVLGGLLFFARQYEASSYKAAPLRVALLHTKEPPIIDYSCHPSTIHMNQWTTILSLLSSIQMDSVDFVLLPESCVWFPGNAELSPRAHLPKDIQDHLSTNSQLVTSLDIAKAISRKLHAPLLIGLEGRDSSHSYNSCFFVGPSVKRYDKQVLIPFGEYIPFKWALTFLSSYGITSGFTPGDASKVFHYKDLSIAPFICYEETFSRFGNEAFKHRPNVLVSLSNDNWFHHTLLRKEHALQGRFRALEMGCPMIRSTNQGLSVAYDALGREVFSSEDEAGCEVVQVSRFTYTPLFQYLGSELFALLLALFTGGVLLLKRLKKRVQAVA